VNDELEIMLNEAVIAKFELLSRNSLEELRKAVKNSVRRASVPVNI
jgi:hypothetical protein